MRAVEPGGRHWAMLNVDISRHRIGDVNTVEWGYCGGFRHLGMLIR